MSPPRTCTLTIGAVVICALAIAGFVAYRASLPLSAGSAAELAQAARHDAEVSAKRARREWLRENATPAFFESCWARARAALIRAGASPAEADGVVASARAKSREPHLSGKPVLALPAAVREGRAGTQKVWLVELAWEASEMSAPSGRVSVGHNWTLVIDATPPHAVLAEESCG